MAYNFKTAVYDKEFSDAEGIVLSTEKDVIAFKKQYKNIFEDKGNRTLLYVGFKDIGVPVAEGQPVIVLIKSYNQYHNQYPVLNDATWKHYDENL